MTNIIKASIRVVCGREIKRTCSKLKNRRYMYSVDKNETKENKIMILESLDNLQLAFGCLKFNRFMKSPSSS